jgi:phosphoglycerate dehydrogenase-like enzyme
MIVPRIVFHGDNAACFHPGIAGLLPAGTETIVLPDQLDSDTERLAYSTADVIVGVAFNATLPRPERLSLFHVPGAGYDAVDLALIPPEAIVCNCFGHEQAIAEYVFAALLERHVPLRDADARLRLGEWAYSSGSTLRLHSEIAGKTIGLLGFGHIGKAIAKRAKAFEMTVVVANRSPVAPSDLVDKSVTLDQLADFWGAADYIVVSVPLTKGTAGIVNAEAFAAMRPDAVVFNVGRGATIDETSLYEALRDRRIGGAVIDTWYAYPSATDLAPLPAVLPFHELSNVVMTPHMSGWTSGTIRRRQQTIADNIRRRQAGTLCENVVRDSLTAD